MKGISHKLIYLTLAVLLVASMLAFGCAKPAPAPAPAPPAMEPVTLIFNGGMFAAPSLHGRVIQRFCSQVEERTDGLITFDNIWSFGLTYPGEEMDSVASGLADLTAFPICFYPSDLFLNNYHNAIPFVPSDIETMLWVEKRMYDELPMLGAEFEEHGNKLLAFEVTGQNTLECTSAITCLEDLKGKKVCTSGVWEPRWYEVIGAVPVEVDTPDLMMALETGLADCSLLPLTVSYPFKVYEKAKYVVEPGEGALKGAVITINSDLFNSFPKDIQQIIVEVGRETSDYWTELEISELEKVKRVIGEAGSTFYAFPREEIAKWQRLVGNAPALYIKQGEGRGLPAREVAEKFLALIAETGYEFPVEWETLPFPK